MDFSKYKNTLPYGRLEDISRIVLEKIDNTPLTVAQRKAAIEEALQTARQELAAIRNKHNAEQNRITNLFRLDVEEELDFSSWPEAVKEKIHDIAWERGHSSGYVSVYSEYFDVVEVVRLAINH